MPIALIEIGSKYSSDYEISLIKAVQSALQQTFKILNHDVNVRLLVHEMHRFSVPKIYEHPELYTLITIDCFPGRSIAIKRDLYRSMVANLEMLNIPKDHIKILIRESGKENWGIRGGQAACDVELGYSVEI